MYYSYTIQNTLPFWDLEIGKSFATVTTNGDLSINNNFTVRPGAWFTNASGNTVNVQGNAILKGNSSSKASFIDNGSFNVTGTSTVESYYADGRWHFIASSVSNALSGIFLNIYLKNWNEADSTWTYITATDSLLKVGKGYEIWSTIGNPTVQYVGGTLNTGNISIPVTATDQGGASGIGAGEGWNFVGNPFPSAIDWGTANNPISGYVRTNLDNTL